MKAYRLPGADSKSAQRKLEVEQRAPGIFYSRHSLAEATTPCFDRLSMTPFICARKLSIRSDQPEKTGMTFETYGL
ncbi:hypothetical protein [Mucilaginibacter paludis]|uniref:hypothetical protein n=1 Tax=Mucilaginibacter paludis TaxID=423351 RepID=UPI001C26868B|nr:hypothetical protein [Mucilaginibacter paludis]